MQVGSDKSSDSSPQHTEALTTNILLLTHHPPAEKLLIKSDERAVLPLTDRSLLWLCVTHVTTGPFSCLTHLEIVLLLLLLLHIFNGSPNVLLCIPPPTVPQYVEQRPVFQQVQLRVLNFLEITH